jgi:glutamyl-tRNA synthetase
MEDLTTGAQATFERDQLDSLAVLGLGSDLPVVRQSERSPIYDAAVDELVSRGLTYPCFCSRREIREASEAPHGDSPEGFYPGTCAALTPADVELRRARGRADAVRLRADGVSVVVRDRLHGEVSATVDDFVLRRGDGVAAYNLAVVVDDAEQGVTQVMRGDDLLSSTPRQVLLQRLLGLPTPEYLHVPLVLGGDGQRLAKRHGAVTLAERLGAGESPERVIGILAASLGWAAPGEELSASDVLGRFDPERIPAAPWVFSG